MEIQKFTDVTIHAVWLKARIILGADPQDLRKDICGALIKRSEYGNRDSINGWEIDHIIPVSRQGSDELQNFQPLQWENNDAKGDGSLKCVRIK